MDSQDVNVPASYTERARTAVQEGERSLRGAMAFAEFLLILALVPPAAGVVSVLQSDANAAWLVAGLAGGVALLVAAYTLRTLCVLARNSTLSLALQSSDGLD